MYEYGCGGVQFSASTMLALKIDFHLMKSRLDSFRFSYRSFLLLLLFSCFNAGVPCKTLLEEETLS